MLRHELSRPAADHKEAVRLSWMSLHIPFGTILIGSLAAASVLSAVLTITALGPVNGIH
jgi:hypothetical protein